MVMTRGELLGLDGASSKDIPAGDTNYALDLAYDAERKLADAGMLLFVLEFGSQSQASAPSEMLAMIGDTGHDAFFVPPRSTTGGNDELEEVFKTILSESVSCEFQLNGKVKQGEECVGEVSIDGELRKCDDPNGWRLSDPDTVEFVGKACEDLRRKLSAQVKARFPCDIFEIL